MSVAEQRNFSEGCWGGKFGALGLSAEGCKSEALVPLRKIAGIPTVLLGFIFYSAISILSLSIEAFPRRRRLISAGSDIISSAALPMCAFFVLHQFRAQAYCPLCIVSASLTLILFILHAVEPSQKADLRTDEGLTAIPFYAVASFSIMLLSLLVLFFVDALGGTAHEPPSNERPSRSRSDLRPTKTIIERDWIDSHTPGIGKNTGVRLILFLDPNCPHCKGTFAEFIHAAGIHKGRAQFFVVGRALWDFSLIQLQALELAAAENKYYEAWSTQFARQQRGGLSKATLLEIHQSLGLSTNAFEQRLEATLPTVIAQKAKANDAGINSTPALFINGSQVPLRLATESIAELIERELSRVPSTSSSSAIR